MTRDWDAPTYDRVADPMTRWGNAMLDRLPLEGDEQVLDAGCGTGRITEALAERLPTGHVVALDGSGEPFETYLRTVVLGAHLGRLPPGEHDAFVRAAADAVGEPVIEYVRLNIVARRSVSRGP